MTHIIVHLTLPASECGTLPPAATILLWIPVNARVKEIARAAWRETGRPGSMVAYLCNHVVAVTDADIALDGDLVLRDAWRHIMDGRLFVRMVAPGRCNWTLSYITLARDVAGCMSCDQLGRCTVCKTPPLVITVTKKRAAYVRSHRYATTSLRTDSTCP